MKRRPLLEPPALGTGPARVGRQLPGLLRRLEPGDVAVIDQVDLDAASAEELVKRGVAAVVNASPSTSGRYPNLGPAVLVDAGIPLVDAVGERVFDEIADGDRLRLEGGTLWLGLRSVATGTLQDADTVAHAAEHARAGLAAQLTDLTGNTTGLLLDERDLLLEGIGIPSLVTELRGRHVLVVTGAYTDALAGLKAYRREHRPVLVAVDGGADTMHAHGMTPDVVVGDPRQMSDAVLTRATDVVVPLDTPGSSRLEALGVTPVSFNTRAGSEDMALLLVAAGDPSLVVAAGLPLSIEHLLDRGREGGAAALLTRLRVGDRLVSPTAAAALVPEHRLWPAGLLVLLTAAGAAVTALAAGRHGFDGSLLDHRWHLLQERLLW